MADQTDDQRPAHGMKQRFAAMTSLALVVLAGLASLGLMQGIDSQIDDMTGTSAVRDQARELSLSLSEGESSQLGYVLTGDERYLAMYARAAAAIDADVAALRAITDEDPGRAAQVSAIAGDVAARIAALERAVALTTAGQTAEARALIGAGGDDRPMDPVRLALERFIAEENRRLLDRDRAINTTRQLLGAAVVLALVGAVALGYILVSRTQRDLRAVAHSRNVLRSENDVLEGRVRDRTQALEDARLDAERERDRVEALLQDTSHRIGNSLATVSSLLGLQMLRSQSEEVRQALEAARARVHAIASAHRRLRLGDDLETVSADEFLDAVLQDLATTAPRPQVIALESEVDPIIISARDATTIGILVAELVTNALKHGFPDGRGGNIVVRLRRDVAGIPTLCVLDDGVGVVADDEQPGEGGLGSVIVKQLAQQFGGVPDYRRRPEGGLAVSMPLPGIAREPVVD